MKQQIYILGAGGVGREILAVLQHTALSAQYEVAGFIDDGKSQGELVKGVPVLGGLDWILKSDERIHLVIAIGNPAIRRQIIGALAHKELHYPVLIHPHASFHDKKSITIGKGTYISEGCIITTDVCIGDFCLLNLGVTINHDAIIEDNCVLMPGVRLSCGVTLGTGSYVGANCALSKPIVYAAHSRVTESA
jgi:sugar O-acyltransferase (sialic acid O-acetyltransferase NeuD family)